MRPELGWRVKAGVGEKGLCQRQTGDHGDVPQSPYGVVSYFSTRLIGQMARTIDRLELRLLR